MPTTARASASSKGLIILLLPLIFGVVVWLIVWPEYGRLKDAWANYDAASTLYDSRSILAKDVENLLAEHKIYKEDFDLLKPALPSAPQVPQLMATLGKLAADNMMTLKSLSVTEESTAGQDVQAQAFAQGAANSALPQSAGSQDPQLSILKAEISVAGTFLDFPIFLAALEKNIRLLEIKILSTRTQEQPTATPLGQPQEITSFRLVLNTFYRK